MAKDSLFKEILATEIINSSVAYVLEKTLFLKQQYKETANLTNAMLDQYLPTSDDLNQISLNIVEDIKQLKNLDDLKTYLIANTVKVKSNDMNFIRDLMANATKTKERIVKLQFNPVFVAIVNIINIFNNIENKLENVVKDISIDDFNYLVKTNITSMFESKQEYMLTLSKEQLLDEYELLVVTNDIEVKIKAIDKIHHFFAVEKSNEMISNSQANINELQFTNNISDLSGDVFELLGNQYKVIFKLIEITYTTKLFLNVVKELIKELR